MASNGGTLVLIMALAVLSPLLAYGLERWIPVPPPVFEIVMGILVGPSVLGWAHHDDFIDGLSNLGLAMLIFLAGYEIDFGAAKGTVLRRALAAWGVCLVAALGLAFALTGGHVTESFVVGTALTSTAVGTVLPVARDAGQLTGRFGTVLSTFGAVGEFGPIIAMSLLLSGRAPLKSALVLVAFAVLTAAALWWATRRRRAWFHKVVTKTLHSSGQFAVRVVMLLLAAMLALAYNFGLDILLGAFAAGVLTRLVLADVQQASTAEVLGRVEAMGFGFLVPLFYVVTGIDFDLDALLDGGWKLALVPIFLGMYLVVRGGPVLALAPDDLDGRQRTALGLYCATCLPLVVAITTIGTKEKVLDPATAAAMVGAAMLTVLLFPLIANRTAPPRG